ncbi:MAG: hypothetical protein VX640_14720 [Pseudomonadota bacterium]|nr:hypothetical protein [Pseudomonadota bacterium]
MILRRVIEHVKAQNWTAVALDFVIVVVGVFVGLQVNNWNEARGDRADEITYLEALGEDTAFSIDSLETTIGDMNRQQEVRAALYNYSIDPAAVLEPEERDRLVYHGLFQLPRLSINQTTFESLKSSGRLGTIRSAKLVSGLQALSAQLDEAITSQNDEEEVTYLFSDPILIEDFDMGAAFLLDDMQGRKRLPWLTKARPAMSAPASMKSARFSNAVLYRSIFTQTRLDSLHLILERYRKIAELIRERQAELGVSP